MKGDKVVELLEIDSNSIAIISFLIMQSPLVVVMVTIRQSAVSRGTEQLQVMII